MQSVATHLAAKDECQEQRHSQLRVAEEDDVEQIWIGGRLQKEPEQRVGEREKKTQTESL